jgi:hypothetical protein
MLVCSVAEVDRNPMIVDKMDLMYDIDLEKEEQSLLSSSQQAPESHWADVWDFMGNNAEVLQSNMLDAIIKLLQKTD